MPKKIDKAILKEVEKLYVKGKKSQKEISELLKISDTTLRKIIRDNGWEGAQLNENEKTEIVRLYCEDGKSIHIIAKELKQKERIIEKFIKDNKLNKKGKQNQQQNEFDVLDELNALDTMKMQLLEKFKDNAYITSVIDNSDIDILLDKAIEYCNGLNELEMDGEEVKKIHNKKMHKIYKISKYLQYKYGLINEILKEKLMRKIRPVLERHMDDVLTIPQPIFKGSIFYDVDDNGISRPQWRKSFNVDIFNDEFNELINTMNNSIRDEESWSIDNYIANKHPELCYDSRDLYEIEYQYIHPEIFIQTAGLSDICVVYDLFRTYNIIKDTDHEALELTEDEERIFNDNSNWKVIYVKKDGKMKLYKNYGKLNILKTVADGEKEEQTRDVRVVNRMSSKYFH